MVSLYFNETKKKIEVLFASLLQNIVEQQVRRI